MLWNSRKHLLDKTEFFAPMDAYQSQKSISILKVFEISSQSTENLPDFLEELLSFLIRSLHFLNFSSETRLTYTSELVNSYEFSKT